MYVGHSKVDKDPRNFQQPSVLLFSLELKKGKFLVHFDHQCVQAIEVQELLFIHQQKL